MEEEKPKEDSGHLDILEKRKNKLKKFLFGWVEDNYDKAFIGILILAFAIRLYYFWMTNGQPLWYDEAEYMSAASHWAFGVPYDLSPKRPVLFAFLVSLFLRAGFNESLVKFACSTLPSILIVLFAYLLVKEMYDKKTALLTSFIFAIFWMLTFYGNRIMTDSLSFLFGIIAVLLFWKGHVKKGKNYLVWLMGLFISLAFLTRLIGILFGIGILLFLILTERAKFLKNKNLWIAFLIAILALVPYMLWYSSYHDTGLFGFITSNVGGEGQGGSSSYPIGWHLLKFVYPYLYSALFIMFVVGFLTLSKLFMSIDLFLKGKNKNLSADFFNLLFLVFVLGFFIFYFRVAEDRWMMAMALPLFVFSAKGILYAFEFVKSLAGKKISVLFLILVLIFAMYSQINFTNELTKAKVDTYSQIKQSSLWIKENSEPEDIVFSNSITQNTYYSQRKTYVLGTNRTQFLEKVQEVNPRYLVVSAFEKYPDWILQQDSEMQSLVTPVNAFFFDKEKTQTAVIIYEFN